MTRELRQITRALLALFAVTALAAAYWGVWRSGALLAREDNARNVLRERHIQRGAIYDRDGALLAESVPDANGFMQRRYPDPSVSGAVGYYSFTYGTAGIEAAFDAELRGDLWLDDWDRFLLGLLHRAQRGGDVRATLDLDVQRAASDALGGRSGAVVLLDVPSGAVLALVSQPNYDPNTLDAHWDALTADLEASPLLNRAVAGLYQPGGTLETAILAAWLREFPDLADGGAALLEAPVPQATAPVRVNGLTLHCLGTTPAKPMTLLDAYAWACPAPFARAFEGDLLTPQRFWELLGTLGLLDPPQLAGFETAASPSAHRLSAHTPPDELTAELVGQGSLTVTPLHMAQLAAAIANRGNGVPVHLADAVRPPSATTWQPLDVPAQQPALLRPDVAEALRRAMRATAERNPALARAKVDGMTLYGHLAPAYAGPDATPYAWFVGFAEYTDADGAPHTVALAVLVENEAHVRVATEVAAAVLRALQ